MTCLTSWATRKAANFDRAGNAWACITRLDRRLMLLYSGTGRFRSKA
jgi:hypothetical protein